MRPDRFFIVAAATTRIAERRIGLPFDYAEVTESRDEAMDIT